MTGDDDAEDIDVKDSLDEENVKEALDSESESESESISMTGSRQAGREGILMLRVVSSTRELNFCLEIHGTAVDSSISCAQIDKEGVPLGLMATVIDSLETKKWRSWTSKTLVHSDQETPERRQAVKKGAGGVADAEKTKVNGTEAANKGERLASRISLTVETVSEG